MAAGQVPDEEGLTPRELASLVDPAEVRGYTPYDRVPEPTEAPDDPASPSPVPVTDAGAGRSDPSDG
ncbi:hypothetical protein RM844_18315 [Streptomyces sp. DSM 44915]|uniref:Uncharacterized protein n=1 Tax=Streptomyces chisholmiae TaxID=3075540 RepID=A0ABU2JTD0_9ACTN|nr:hypothetical protein [Streptomyces sp. DSM 44915]MDT0268242.1 hypothetical protein [Streptomyces sp. DSM 44915]